VVTLFSPAARRRLCWGGELCAITALVALFGPNRYWLRFSKPVRQFMRIETDCPSRLPLFCRPSKFGNFHCVFPKNHARLTEIQSAFIEHPQKQPNQLDSGDLAKEFIMSASQPSKFAPSPSQSRPRHEFVFEPLLDSDEAAELLRIHPKTLQRMARNRQIHGIQVGKLWRFRASDLEIWLSTKRAG
jgi:excisionase family DNA binding protein